MTGKLSRIVFKKSPELYGQSGSLCSQRIVAQDDVVTVGIEISATAHMQDHLAAAGRIVVDDAFLSKAIGYEAKFLALTVVTLVKVDVQDLGVKYIQFMGWLIIVCLFHAYDIEPVENAFGKEETVYLNSIVADIVKGGNADADVSINEYYPVTATAIGCIRQQTSAISKVEYFTLDGMLVDTPQVGVNIRRITYSNGTITTDKVIF